MSSMVQRPACRGLTYIRHGKRWRVLIRPLGGARITRVVTVERDAIELVRHFNRLGMAGVDLAEALRQARARAVAPAPTFPTLREALPGFLEEQVKLGNLRQSTANAYRKGRLARWAYPRIGDTPWNLITREKIGAVLLAIRRAGKSSAVVEQIRSPIARFYAWQVNVNGWKGVNPAADLRYFIGKQRPSAPGSTTWSGSGQRKLRPYLKLVSR